MAGIATATEHELVLAELDQILRSETFATSEMLRRLLKFLLEKSVTGEADKLKEYTVGVDGLGRPGAYDPRQDASVRIQVGRLRQKLAEYYQREGRQAKLIFDLPKGHFKLTWKTRPVDVVEVQPLAPAAFAQENKSASPVRKHRTAFLGIGLAVTMCALIYTSILLRQEQRLNASLQGEWSPELQQLWQPFLNSSRPLLLTVGTPLFVRLGDIGFYREFDLDNWDSVVRSGNVSLVRRALSIPQQVEPRFYYAAFGEVKSSLMLGKLLGARQPSVSVVKSSELSWQQLADNNVIFLGAPRFFEQLHGMPVPLELVLERTGIRKLVSKPGEPDTLTDRPSSPWLSKDGEIYALITHTPGPLGNGDVESFASNETVGRTAAVQWFTDLRCAQVLVSKMRKPSGEIPRYFQVVLKVKFKDDVPIETSYILHRELHPAAHS